ncbi:hypothetical protein HELRODRAFT_173814 [Helobdella robusta]|uniref:WAP domain-containing protein n=1 Tax=Helobdella robusta TaxID=6412 RepID=T1F796_HELRO|nr:hypothetical protein HELRODRAFT_173814 [Helobdella robusta]ESO02980.1 hypothetical protein HELRODRAFT_173814 [Helobdella robusta]
MVQDRTGLKIRLGNLITFNTKYVIGSDLFVILNLAIHEEPYESDDLKTLSRKSQNYEDDSKCPPPPTNLLPIVGDGVECTSDIQCRDEDSKCCYNGDKYTCMPTVKPPPCGTSFIYFSFCK